MAKVIRYQLNWFDDGVAKYEAGKHYPISDETLRHVAIGIATEIEVDLSLEDAQAKRVAADAAAARASTAAQEAQLLADAARVAEEEAARAEAIVAAVQAEETKARQAEGTGG